MAKKAVTDGASLKDKKAFQKFLAEDEELVVATGYGKNYLRHRFAFYIIFPGLIFMIAALGWVYYQSLNQPLPQDYFQKNLGFGLLYGLVLAITYGLIKALHVYHSHRYLLTTRRVIIKEGFFAVKLTSALYDKITHIEVDQGFMDRLIMKHGNIIINTAGGNKDELKLMYVEDPIQFKNLLERLINREREQYGRQTGSVVTVEGELVEE